MEKKLYPFKFIPVASRRPWGGNALVNDLGKKFVEVDSDGNESVLGSDVLIGESWELADMGIEDSVVAEGWLAGNTISEHILRDLLVRMFIIIMAVSSLCLSSFWILMTNSQSRCIRTMRLLQKGMILWEKRRYGM